MSSSRVLVVWGMHRSGTSMLASWLAACGLDIGRELLGNGLGNERGHYEDTEFLGLHERILNDNSIYCGGLLRVDPIKVSQQFLSQMKALVEEKSKRATQWGWKEPRTCLFYNEYNNLIPDAFHLFVFRDYRLVVDSLVRRKVNKYKVRNSKRRGLKFYYYKVRIYFWRKFFMHKFAERYLEAWIKYNENLISLSKALDSRRIHVICCSDFVRVGKSTFSWLHGAGFNLSYVEVEQSVDTSMMAVSAVNNYNFNSAAVLRANAVLASLEKLAINGC